MSIVWSSDSFHLARLLVCLARSKPFCMLIHAQNWSASTWKHAERWENQTRKKMQTLKSVSCRQPTYVLSTTYFSHPLQFTWCFRWIFRGKLYIWDVCGVVFFSTASFSLVSLAKRNTEMHFCWAKLGRRCAQNGFEFYISYSAKLLRLQFFSSSIQEIIRLVESCE